MKHTIIPMKSITPTQYFALVELIEQPENEVHADGGVQYHVDVRWAYVREPVNGEAAFSNATLQLNPESPSPLLRKLASIFPKEATA